MALPLVQSGDAALEPTADGLWRALSVRLTAEEKAALRRARAEFGRSCSAQARRYLVEALQRDGFLPSRGQAPDLDAERSP